MPDALSVLNADSLLVCNGGSKRYGAKTLSFSCFEYLFVHTL